VALPAGSQAYERHVTSLDRWAASLNRGAFLRSAESHPSTEYGRQDDWNFAHTRPSIRTLASTAAGGRRTTRAPLSPHSMARGSRKRWATP